MADRKKQPTRGARKPRSPKRNTDPVTVEPLKVNIQLIGIQRNSKNEIVGEAVMLEGPLLPPDFSTIPKRLKDAVKAHQAALAAPPEESNQDS